jgi:hypothetical protein
MFMTYFYPPLGSIGIIGFAFERAVEIPTPINDNDTPYEATMKIIAREMCRERGGFDSFHSPRLSSPADIVPLSPARQLTGRRITEPDAASGLSSSEAQL